MVDTHAAAARALAVPPLRPEYLRDIVAGERHRRGAAAAHGLATARQPGWLRKAFILFVIAAAWQLYARWLNNPLLVPTFTATLEAFAAGMVSGDLPQKVANSVRAAAQGLCHRAGAGDGLHRARDDVAHRQRPARDLDLGIQSVARDRAPAARADLVRPGRHLDHLRAGAFGAVGGRAQHPFGIPVGLQHAAHGRAQLRPQGPALHRARS